MRVLLELSREKQVRAEERHELYSEVGYDFRVDCFTLNNQLGDSSLGEVKFSSLSHGCLRFFFQGSEPVIRPFHNNVSIDIAIVQVLFRQPYC